MAPLFGNRLFRSTID